MSSLPPPHPSLPRPPQAYSQYSQPQNNVSFPIEHSSYYNSHYAQAYNQYPPSYPGLGLPQSIPTTHSQTHPVQRPHIHAPPSSHWYQAGNQRCSQQGCSFTGSSKSVEIHMMDRHLIYPPGWEKRKKKPDWDADPSLKGKPVPIQGTNIILDSPEVLEAWIAERKKRFPTASKVEDKKRKLEEASARGQLDLSDIGLAQPKRRKVDQQQGSRHNAQPSRGRGHQQRHNHIPLPPKPAPPSQPESPANTSKRHQTLSSSREESDDDGDAPEAISSKPPESQVLEVANIEAVPPPSAPVKPKQTPSARPRNPPRNPFASRPTLLRNLIAPEIRITVSNLSQAIRFLVDNDFLRNVELKPGEAAEKNKIEVLTSSSAQVENS